MFRPAMIALMLTGCATGESAYNSYSGNYQADEAEYVSERAESGARLHADDLTDVWLDSSVGPFIVDAEARPSVEQYGSTLHLTVRSTNDAGDNGMFIMDAMNFDMAAFDIGARTLTWEDGFVFTICGGPLAQVDIDEQSDEADVVVSPAEDGSRHVWLRSEVNGHVQEVEFTLPGQLTD